MQKPITVAAQEFDEKIVEIINSSGLPFFIIAFKLRDLLDSVQQGAQAQLRNDLAQYEKGLKKEAGENETSKSGENTDPPETEE